MGWSGDWYPPASRPLPAEGIKAKSRRGDIGETWWSQRFIAVLESIGMGNRLQRGRRYARAGQVLDLVIAAGQVSARVQGSRPAPYKVRVAALPLPVKEWSRVEQALASRAVFLAKLLAGEMPKDVEDAFAACSTSLFPSSARELTTDCTCPDWANPCKHIAAVFYLLAESFDEDPFEMFAWRGRTRGELLAGLRQLEGAALSSVPAGGGPGTGGWSLPLVTTREDGWDVAGFYAGSGAPPLQAAPLPDAGEVAADAILRGLDEVASTVRGRPLSAALSAAYPLMTAYARELMLGSDDDG